MGIAEKSTFVPLGPLIVNILCIKLVDVLSNYLHFGKVSWTLAGGGLLRLHIR